MLHGPLSLTRAHDTSYCWDACSCSTGASTSQRIHCSPSVPACITMSSTDTALVLIGGWLVWSCTAAAVHPPPPPISKGTSA